MQSSILTDNDIETIISLYNEGKSQRYIGRLFNQWPATISDILIENNIETRPFERIIHTDINMDFFRDINNELNSYFLGFLYADGSVSSDMYSVSIHINNKDIEIVEKFRDIMSPKSNIKYNNADNAVYIRINRKEICEQLVKLGCGPKKSLTLQFPDCVPDHLLHHFMRGYSDGDGSIYKVAARKSFAYSWALMASEGFANTGQKKLKDILDINVYNEVIPTKQDGINVVKMVIGGNNQVEKALDWLYKDATIYLQRKYDKYIEFKEYKDSKPYTKSIRLNITPAVENEIINGYNAGSSSIKLSNIFCMSKPSILSILHKNNVKMRKRWASIEKGNE